MIRKNKLTRKTFNEFCHENCDGLYEPRLQLDSQCSGYINLKKMVKGNISPASLNEIKRWESFPANEELKGTPDIKYLRFLHKLLRPYIIEKWSIIKNMKL